jgi:hypothetical protein
MSERGEVSHYLWAGLDFLIDRDGTPVFIEANRASHMLGEYMQFMGNERPFEITAAAMNRAAGPPCFLWRRDDPFPDADEDACFIGRHLEQHLHRSPVICNVEDNQEARGDLVARDGRRVVPGSIFRWWYGLPWNYERSGVTVINPNCVWVTVRDKLACSQTLAGAHNFRVPRSFAVEAGCDAQRLLAENEDCFSEGYVLRPRIGWGGYGVQVADRGAAPREINGRYVLSERIIPPVIDGRFWEARVFVMNGICLGGLRHTSHSPLTNYWQGGRPEPLDEAVSGRLEAAALEAVRLLDAAADTIHRLPEPPNSPLTNVVYEGTGVQVRSDVRN